MGVALDSITEQAGRGGGVFSGEGGGEGAGVKE